jgi:hypothetical protein
MHPMNFVLPESVHNNDKGDLSFGSSLSNLNQASGSLSVEFYDGLDHFNPMEDG